MLVDDRIVFETDEELEADDDFDGERFLQIDRTDALNYRHAGTLYETHDQLTHSYRVFPNDISPDVGLECNILYNSFLMASEFLETELIFTKLSYSIPHYAGHGHGTCCLPMS